MNREQIITLLKGQKNLMRRYSVESIYLFGSVARNDATDTSDVDLLVAFNPDARVSLFQFSRLRRELSQVLDCHVDLATPDSLHKDLKADILKEAVHAA
jgi:predicted nucleotidyltransferase